jgi:16S rRNA (cytosine967-C5)-methyltransferase
VHGYVEIAKQSRGLAPYKNLINAILRRAGREREVVRTMSAMVHLPNWLQTSWVKAYGEEAVLASIAQMLVEPSLDIALKTPSLEAAEQLLSFREGYAPYPAMVRLNSAQGVNLMPGFEAGNWWVQDISAQMPVLLFGDVTGKSVADFCAAPGGKTMQLASRGAHVTSIDISEERLSRVHENLARTGLTADVQVQDLAKSKLAQSFDAVLLDAPCSATGTLRRNPDVTMHRRPEDIGQLQALQRKLLQTAVEALKSGGTLVYSVCSLEPEEGEEQAKWLVQTFPEMQPQPIAPEHLPLLAEGINAQGQLRLLPHMLQGPTPRLSGVDGFFAARFTKA